MKEKIQTFIERHPEKSPIFLINFPLEVKKNNENLELVDKMSPTNNAMLDLIASFKNSLNIALLLIADDKSSVIRRYTGGDIIYNEGNELTNLRRRYYKSNQIPLNVSEKGLSGIIMPTSSGKNVFSELYLGNRSKNIISNQCAQAYHTLLGNEIDRQRYMLIALFPSVCYQNLVDYLQSKFADDLQEETNFSVQSIFVDEMDGSQSATHKIIEL